MGVCEKVIDGRIRSIVIKLKVKLDAQKGLIKIWFWVFEHTQWTV